MYTLSIIGALHRCFQLELVRMKSPDHPGIRVKGVPYHGGTRACRMAISRRPLRVERGCTDSCQQLSSEHSSLPAYTIRTTQSRTWRPSMRGAKMAAGKRLLQAWQAPLKHQERLLCQEQEAAGRR